MCGARCNGALLCSPVCYIYMARVRWPVSDLWRSTMFLLHFVLLLSVEFSLRTADSICPAWPEEKYQNEEKHKEREIRIITVVSNITSFRALFLFGCRAS